MVNIMPEVPTRQFLTATNPINPLKIEPNSEEQHYLHMGMFHGILGEIAKIAGQAAALEIAKQLGGTQISIPKVAWREDAPIPRILGSINAEILRQKLGCGTVYIPNMKTIRNSAAARYYRSHGKTTREIAIILNLSLRQVARLVE